MTNLTKRQIISKLKKFRSQFPNAIPDDSECPLLEVAILASDIGASERDTLWWIYWSYGFKEGLTELCEGLMARDKDSDGQFGWREAAQHWLERINSELKEK